MNFELTEEQQAIVAMVRDLAGSQEAPSVNALAELGLLSIATDPQWGGTGLGLSELSLCLEELAATHPSVARTLQVHNLWCVGALERLADDETKQRLLPALAQRLGSYGMQRSDGTIANVVKGAAVETVVQQTESGDWSVAHGTFRVANQRADLGFRDSKTVSLVANDCEVLGLSGDADSVRNRAHVGAAAVAVGIAQGALRAGAVYATERKQFDQSIAKFQAIQWKLADSAAAVDSARLMVRRAAWMADAGRLTTRIARMARASAIDAARLATDHSVQIHGGYGYTEEYAVEGLYRDARALAFCESSPELDRDHIAATLMQ